MYQSIPAVNIPPDDPQGFAHPFSSLGFYLQIYARGPRFRRDQIFPEMNENLLNISIFRVWFQEAIQNRRKTPVFVYANCFFAREFLPQGPGFCSLSLPGEWRFRPLKLNSPGVGPGVS